MHELSLAQGVIQLVEGALAREGNPRLKRVVVEVGALAGVELSALQFSLDALQPHSVLAGAVIDITQALGQAWCLDCAVNVSIASRLDCCPRCGGSWLQPNGGTEVRVRELTVENQIVTEESSPESEGETPCVSPAAATRVH